MSYYYDFEGFARPKKTIPQNVPYDTWAPQMWSQFDTLGNNFTSSQDFSSQVHNLINQIPCPECKTDGLSYVKTNPPENITSKAQAQGWVKNYHNHVNQLAAKKSGWGFYQAQTEEDGPQGKPWIPGEDPKIDEIIYKAKAKAGKPGAPGGGIGGGGGGGGNRGDWVVGGFQPEGGSHHVGAGGGGFQPGGGSSTGGGFHPGFSRDLVRDPWYSTMWAQLHEYANDYNPLTFADDVRNQIEEIPTENERCYRNSRQFIHYNPPENVRTRDQAMYWMCKFHNWASLDAGNGLVDCDNDSETGYGYVSGHDDYRDFFYGGGSRGGGGGQQGGGRGGGRHKKRGRGGGMRGGGMRQGGGMGPMGGMNQMNGGGYALTCPKGQFLDKTLGVYTCRPITGNKPLNDTKRPHIGNLPNTGIPAWVGGKGHDESGPSLPADTKSFIPVSTRNNDRLSIA